MQLAFGIRAWSALAPGLEHSAQWLQWAEQPQCPQGALQVSAAHIPAMARRRLGPLARMAVTVADAALAQAASADLPVVWASRYGDADKSLDLLQQQAQQQPLSPTAFGLSVHNGVGAQHSILRGMRSNAVCVASSWATPEAGVVEALGLLHEGAGEVLLVCYDAPLPGAYAGFHDEAMVDFAWAALLTLPQAGAPRFALQAGADLEGQKGLCSMPHALNVLHFLLQPRCASLVRSQGASAWRWERLHA